MSHSLPTSPPSQKTCFSPALALVTYTMFPTQAPELHEHPWLHQARISSSAPLKLGTDRGLICKKRNTHCKGRVHSSSEGGRVTNRAWWGIGKVFVQVILQHSAVSGSEVDERGASVYREQWRARSSAAQGLCCLQERGEMPGIHFLCLHTELFLMGALPQSVLHVYRAFFICKGF